MQRPRCGISSMRIPAATRRTSPNVYYNLNAGDPAQWLYAPDVSRREYSDRTFENASGRVTWQVTPRNKVSGFWDAQALCRTCTGATPGLAEPARVSPEAVGVLGRPLHVSQATWSSPVDEPAALRSGYGGTFFGVGNFEREPNPTRDLIRVAEQCASGCAANGNIPGLVYRSQDFSVAHTGSYLWKGSVSYVTGAHSLKIGYQHTLMTDDRTWMTNNQNLTYRVNNGVPNQLTQSISPWVNNARAAWDGLFAQEQWTRRRLTLQGAVRFDRARSWFPAQQEGPSRFLPTPIIIPETRGVDSYKDITPRMGAAYDVFGNGRTAIKVNLGKYLEGAGVSGNYANTNPTLRMPQTTMVFGTAGVTRAWTDAQPQFRARLRSAEPCRAGSSAARRRSVRRAVEHELRQERPDQQLRPGHPRRLGRPSVGLEPQRLARSSRFCPRSRSTWRTPPLVPRILCGRQPLAAAVRSDAVQPRGAPRSPVAWRRGLRGLGPLRCRPREVRTGRQPRRRLDRLWRVGPVLQRRRRDRQRANRQRLRRSRAERAQARPSQTTATCARICRSSPPRRRGRARLAPDCTAPP